MRVLFAPDYRSANAYQGLLAGALASEGVDVTFLNNYRRVLPLWRGVGTEDLLHLHWPEHYYIMNFARKVRYRLDLGLTAQKMKIVLTAHDLMPHNRGGERLVHFNVQLTMDVADAIFVHSAAALDLLREVYLVPMSKCHLIPHGDLTTNLGPLPSRYEARRTLGLQQTQRICLMFGAVQPYKGIEPVISWWRSHSPSARLAIVGRPLSSEYAKSLIDLASDHPAISFDLDWQPSGAHAAWLAAVDCILFNYRTVLTSGAACEARALGVPVLLPSRHDSIFLGEPHPLVFRFDSFESDFRTRLEAALSSSPDYEGAKGWRELTSWRNVAHKTAAVYRSLGG